MQAAEADLNTLVSELAHRGRNGLTIIMSIVSQSARKAVSAQDLENIVNGRLRAMAEAQDEVVRGGGQSALLESVLERTLTPFDMDRFIFDPSPSLEVPGETASALALLTHELATNAIKYGALSTPQGRVRIAWEVAAGSVRLRWREHGGPAVQEPHGGGFGTRLLTSALASQGGYAERRFEPDGMVCEVIFTSVPHVRTGEAPDGSSAPASRGHPA
jgi:two-component sensor histidine kinase